MDSPPSVGDMDPKKIIALVGTDKLDGSELDNVKTGLTPPCQSLEFFDNTYDVENIATPMRFDEEECLSSEFSGIKGEYIEESISSSYGAIHVKQEQLAPPIEAETSSTVYSTQLSKISLDDILPIINRERPPIEFAESTEGHCQEKRKKMSLSSRHSWDIASTSYSTPCTSRQSSSTGSIPKPKRQFVCSYEACRRAFNRSDELNRHLRVHSGIKPYTCDFCQKKFARSDHLKTHRRTHTGERPFECEVCAKKFARSDEKSRHSRTHARGRGLSRTSTAPEMAPSSGPETPSESAIPHRSSDGQITYK